MTKDEALKLALEALEEHPGNYKLSKDECVKYRAVEDAIREALAEQPAQQQEPVAYSYTSRITGAQGFSHHPLPRLIDAEWWDIKPLYTSAPRKPLTDKEFLELVLRKGTQELVGAATFVGGSIQMQGKIGLLRSAKIIKEFVEAAHGIEEEA